MITICIPTKDRPTFLGRLLSYYTGTRYRHWIFIGDSSGPEQAQRNQRTVAAFDGQLKITYWEDPRLSSCAFMEQMSQHISTPYCALVGDDDFLCTRGIDQCLAFLERHPEYGAAHGKGLMLETDEGGPYGTIRSTRSYSQAILKSDTGSERLNELFTASPYALLYSVHRTDIWRDMFRGLMGLQGIQNQNIFKDELIPTAVSVVRGKVKELDSLYLIRQMHDAIARHPHVYDWITSPEWFPSFQAFHERLVQELIRQDGIPVEQARIVIRQSFWPYLAQAVLSTWHKQQASPPPQTPSRLRRMAKRIPGLRPVWRKLRSALQRYRIEQRDRQGLTLSVLLGRSSPFHEDFMPIYDLITSRSTPPTTPQDQVETRCEEAVATAK